MGGKFLGDPVVSLLRVWVQNLVGKLRFYKPRSMAIEKERKKTLLKFHFLRKAFLDHLT